MPPKLTITLPDNSTKRCKKGVTGVEIAESIGPRLAKAALAVKVNGELHDLSFPITQDASIQIITFDSDEGKHVFWHSSAHLLAQAVVSLWPDAKITIGPAVEMGFYYDFEKKDPFTLDDLKTIEKKMETLVKQDLGVKREELTVAEAKKLFKKNPYKIELIGELAKGAKNVSVYRQGDFVDLCQGPHVPRTGCIAAFALTKISSAYWRGDAKNTSLQRIYGVSFPESKQLKEYLHMLEEAEKRDHKKIGKEMELFMQSELVGKGLPLWLPKGFLLRSEVEKLAFETEKKAGYVRVATPHLAKKELFLMSGHLPYYQDGMYPEMKLDDGGYYLKAMNCPHHHLIFKHKARSYRELPLRIAEYGTCYRNELSGTLSGLLRVRMLTMNDAHIYCTKEQIEQEFASVIKMIVDYYAVFGFTNYHFQLSLYNPANKEKYIDEPQNWTFTETILRNVLKKLDVRFVEAIGEAAFYGPKVDIQYKAVTGREETMSTVQLDFAAKNKFDLSYADKNGSDNHEVYVIHRAPLSTHERFMAFIIEHYAGKFPLWLNPNQIVLLPLADRHLDYCMNVKAQMDGAGLRVEVNDAAETANKKVRDAQLQHFNYILVVGDKEVANGTVNVRTRDEKVHGEKKVATLVKELVEEVKSRK